MVFFLARLNLGFYCLPDLDFSMEEMND